MDAADIVRLLNLQPHPEGGFYRETYRSAETVCADGLPPRYGSHRNLGTAIYYLLTLQTFSALHRLKSDEVLHFYLGDPVTMFQLHPDGRGQVLTLGSDLAAGQMPQCVVPRGVWFGLHLRDGGRFALLGATVAPGFEFDDFEMADRQELLARYPEHAEIVRRLTHQ